MSYQWYYKVMGETVGPLSAIELREQAIKLSPDPLVTQVGAPK